MSRVFLIIPVILFSLLRFPPKLIAVDRDITLEPRLGVAHVGTAYPDRHTTGDLMSWGVDRAFKLGFNSVELFIPSNMCYGNSPTREPYGPYQARDKFCEPLPSRHPKAKSLTEFVQQTELIKSFAVPVERFYLTAYPLNPTFRSASRKETSGIPYTQEELDSLSQEYYDFTKYLLSNYQDSKKVFSIMPVVTMDRWLSGRDLASDESPGVCTESDSAPKARIDNMIAYISTISNAIHRAAQENSASKSKVYLTCEINSFTCAQNNPAIKQAINSVIPHAGCDLVGLAGYELLYYSSTVHRNDPNFLRQAFNYLASQVPDHPDFPGGKNIVISEVGLREQQGTQSDADWFVNTFLKTALNWGMPHVQLWALGYCHVYNPTIEQQGNSQICPGWWMNLPDGTISKVYRALKTTNQVAPPVPPSPSPKPGDLNGDGSVNLLDFNLLITSFGNPYTLAHFNQVIINFGL